MQGQTQLTTQVKGDPYRWQRAGLGVGLLDAAWYEAVDYAHGLAVTDRCHFTYVLVAVSLNHVSRYLQLSAPVS